MEVAMRAILCFFFLPVVILLVGGNVWAQVDFNKDIINNLQQPVNNIDVNFYNPVHLSGHYDGGGPGGWVFQTFVKGPDPIMPMQLKWLNPLPGPIPLLGTVHIGWSVEDRNFYLKDMCFTLFDSIVGPVIQIWPHTPDHPGVGNLIVSNTVSDSICGPHPRYFIGNVSVEFYAQRQPLATLNTYTPRIPMGVYNFPPQSVSLPRFASHTYQLPTPPPGALWALWIFKVGLDSLFQMPFSRDFVQFPIDTGNIQGMKFRDHDGDGIKDPGDEPLAGWTIIIKDSLGNVIGTTQTDASGNYFFGGLPPGEYFISEVIKFGWIQTKPNSGTYTVNLPLGGSITGLDFGNSAGSVIFGHKYNDIDGDGRLDQGEPPMAGWVIILYDSSGHIVAVDSTDVNGYYGFSILRPGVYRKREIVPDPWVATAPLGIDTGVFVPIAHDSTNDNEIILNFKKICVSGYKYNDRNGNGVKDPGDVGLPGWTIEATWGGHSISTVTDSTGYYRLCYVGPDTVTLFEHIKAGWIATYPPGGMYRFKPYSGMDKDSLNFLNYKGNCVSGVKFLDLDKDGVRDLGEPGLPGWTIHLLGGAGGERVTVTDDSGHYTFCDITPGAHTVCEEVKPGWMPTCDTCYSFVAISGVDYVHDFCNFNTQICITGVKYNDRDGDGVRDPGEEGLAGWTIKVSWGGNIISTVTDSTGFYRLCFTATDTVSLSEIVQNGWVATQPPGGIYHVILVTGRDTVLNFGNFKKACVVGVKFYDRDRDGVRDSSETGISDWPIYLHNGAGGVTTMLTDANGYYSICNLGPGQYTVCEHLPPGWAASCDTCYTFNMQSGTNVTYNFCNYGCYRYRTFICAEMESISCAKIKPQYPPPRPGHPWAEHHKPNHSTLLLKVNPIHVGIVGCQGSKCPPYFLSGNYKQIMTSYCDRGITHTQTPRGFDWKLGASGITPMRGRWKEISPAKKHNNHLFQELLTLQINLKASAMGITPKGLSSLVYNDPPNPLSNLTIQQIADTADVFMTYWYYIPLGTYKLFDTVVAKINAAFQCAWAYNDPPWQPYPGILEMPGCRCVEDVSYLKEGKGDAPSTRYLEPTPEELPLAYKLDQNYPNPFNPTTTIQFELPAASRVTLKIYNMLGQEVASLLEQEELEGGVQEVLFDAGNLPSGVYICRLTAESLNEEGVPSGETFVGVKKMMLVK